MSLRVKILTVALIPVVVVSSFAASAAAYVPKQGFAYNNPYGSATEQYSILKKVNDGLRNAPKGSTVRIAMYSGGVQSFTDAVLKAHQRGVHIRVVSSAHSTSGGHWKKFTSALGTNVSKKSFAVSCRGGCFTSREQSSQHAKLYTFSKTGNYEKVSMISSANPTTTQAEKGFNSLYTVNGNPEIYTAFYRYIDAMAASANKTDLIDYYRTRTSGPFTAYLMPSVERRAHPYAQILDKVSCSAKGDFGRGGRTTVRIKMSIWTEALSGLAEKLVALDNKGCVVEAIVSTNGTNTKIQRILLRDTRNGGVELRTTTRDLNGDGTIDRYVHDKAIAVSGGFGGSQTKSVWTGSFNLSTSGFRSNNDVLLKIKSANSWQQFTDQFKSLKRYSPLMNKPSSSSPGARTTVEEIFDMTPEQAFPESYR